MAARKPKSNRKPKDTDRDKEYLQSLKAQRATQQSMGKSPSASTRKRTSVVRERAAVKKYYNASTPKALAYLLTKQKTKNEKAADKVYSSFVKQSKAEDKDMARRRRLMNAKKNVNKRAR